MTQRMPCADCGAPADWYVDHRHAWLCLVCRVRRWAREQRPKTQRRPLRVIRVESDNEIVAHNCYMHLEYMDDDEVWIGLATDAAGLSVSLTSDTPIKMRTEEGGP